VAKVVVVVVVVVELFFTIGVACATYGNPYYTEDNFKYQWH
jgi:hypothetical protein